MTTLQELTAVLPDSIEIPAIAGSGLLEFDFEGVLDFEDWSLEVKIKGYQEMTYSSGETEQGIPDGYEINEDAEIHIEALYIYDVFIFDRQVLFNKSVLRTLRKNIHELITLN